MNIRQSLARVAGGNIAKHLIVKPDSTAGQVVIATAATDLIIGCSDEIDHVATDPVDVYFAGLRLLKAGGNIAPGDRLTANASGQAIATTTAGNAYVGIATEAAAAGDLFWAIISPGTI